jgi:hypothetical protein
MSKRKKLFIALVGIAMLVLGGIAYATWSAVGSGSGTATAKSAVNITVAGSPGTADLYPGGSGAVYFTLDNTNPYAVTFTDMVAGSPPAAT